MPGPSTPAAGRAAGLRDDPVASLVGRRRLFECPNRWTSRGRRRDGRTDTTTSLADRVAADDVRFLLVVFVDLTGKPCAKLVPASCAGQVQTDGVGFAGYAVGAIGQQPHDPDLVVVPDPSSYTPVPAVREGLAVVHGDPHVEGAPWPYAPRLILRRALERTPHTLVAGAEVEYFLLAPRRRRHAAPRRRPRRPGPALLRRPRPDPDVRPPHRGLRRDGRHGLGQLRQRPRGRQRAVRAELRVRRRPAHGRPTTSPRSAGSPAGATATRTAPRRPSRPPPVVAAW